MSITTEPKTQSTPQYPENEQLKESALLSSIANGDRLAFTEFCDLYRGLIYSVVHRVINNAEDSQDLTQEVLWQVWKKASSFERSKGKPRTWIVTMARNRAIDRVRANGRRSRLREAASNEATVAEQIGNGATTDPTLAAVASERRDIVRSAILELTDKQKQVVELAYFAELTQVQIAEQLGEPLGTVKARIRRSVKRLHAIVEERLES